MKPPAVREVNGQKRVQVYPNGMGEGLLFPGLNIEVYLEPGKEVSQGGEYQEAKKKGTGAFALVLGAGNQASIPFLDSLHRMYVRNEVVFLKHNPAAEYMYTIVEKVMQPFITRDFFHHAKGGIAGTNSLPCPRSTCCLFSFLLCRGRLSAGGLR